MCRIDPNIPTISYPNFIKVYERNRSKVEEVLKP